MSGLGALSFPSTIGIRHRELRTSAWARPSFPRPFVFVVSSDFAAFGLSLVEVSPSSEVIDIVVCSAITAAGGRVLLRGSAGGLQLGQSINERLRTRDHLDDLEIATRETCPCRS